MGAGELVRPLPIVHPDNERFWASLREHVLRLQKCLQCGRVRCPVSPVCPTCLSEEHEWVEMSRIAQVVVAVDVMRATGDPWWQMRVPFKVALVRFPEGVQMKGFLEVGRERKVEFGESVEVGFEDAVEGVTFLKFTVVVDGDGDM